MQFSLIPGQDNIRQKLVYAAEANRVSHALLFSGRQGRGKLALAMAYAGFLNCTDPQKYQRADSCGNCPSCVKMKKLVHPDVHYIYPVAANTKIAKPISKDFLPEWRDYLLNSNFFPDFFEWVSKINVENKQAIICVRDCEDMISTLNLKSYEGNYKVVVIWLAEKLFHAAAPKVLKILEEPPDSTVFLLVSENPEQIIPTILSRLQRIRVPVIPENEAVSYLSQFSRTDTQEITFSWKKSNQNLKACLLDLDQAETEADHFLIFSDWMRRCYKFNIAEILESLNLIVSRGREWQKSFLNYSLDMIRNCLLLNNNNQALLQLHESEKKFLQNFSPFIHNRNAVTMSGMIGDSILQIERNANPSLVLLDVSLKFYSLLHQK